MKRITLYLILVTSLFIAGRTKAEPSYDAQRLVELSLLSFERFLKERQEETFRKLVSNSKGVFICPELMRGAFVFGVSGGNGVFLVWDDKEKNYIGPAFYTLGGLSFGLQAGGSISEVLLLFMTQRGLSAMLATNVKIGLDLGIAIGPKGGGAKAGSANLSADVLAYYTSKGLFGGLSLDGGVIKVRGDLNRAYYGREVTPIDILVTKAVRKDDSKRFTNVVKGIKGQ
ncbi:MAG: lipid-binding SYLF domain-containing protein [Desulfobacterota bacterium]|nr:lipid-binding SYLF domain-containing protein [Thermodesulfobacteriota bacterium]MDW8001264.1 lipid-binding SYLF domain-containing protein [Deltaproteobacteria bacterium]